MNDIIGTADLALICGITQNTARKWCQEHRVDAVQDRAGSTWHIDVHSIPRKKLLPQYREQLYPAENK